MYLLEVTLMVVFALSMALGANVPGPPPGGLGSLGAERVLPGQPDPSESYEAETSATPCDEARQKCAFRSGCGLALGNYVVGCAGVLYDSNPNPTHCPITCQHALIALTSSDEGKELTQCNCTDEQCREQKKRVEVCRPSVLKATRDEAIVSCEVAQWICSSDGQCSTALEYYHKYCKAMFRGKKCSKRCLNSINILMRQEKAKKLNTCICNSHDDAQCWTVQRNMDKLCFNKTREPERPESNEIQPNASDSSCSPSHTPTFFLFTSASFTSSLSLILLLKSISRLLTAI